jgi:hypothetical protein
MEECLRIVPGAEGRVKKIGSAEAEPERVRKKS